MGYTTLVFCGDALPDVSPNAGDPFASAAQVLAAGEVRFVNLEGCITAAPDPAMVQKKRNVLWAGPHSVAYMRRYGFDVVNVANNHSFDLGEEGCRSTIRKLREHGMAVVGERNGRRSVPAVLSRDGMSIGFVAYADYGFPSTLTPLRQRRVQRDIRRLQNSVDLVVVSLHWGYEYVRRPSPHQRRIARSFVDAGADIIVGHHPHVSQGIEEYRGAVICYSLGNLFLRVDEMPGRLGAEARDLQYGFVLKVVADSSGVHSYEPVPVSAFGRDEVVVLNGHARKRSLARLGLLSKELDASQAGYLAWIWDASGTFALLFRRAWADVLVKYGLSWAVGLVREIVQQPILFPLLCVSFIRFPFGRKGHGR